MDWKKVKKHVASTTVEERNAKRQAVSERDVEIFRENYGKVASGISNDAESRDYVSSAKTAANAGAISALERRRQRAEEYLEKNTDKYKNGKELLSETKNLFTSIEDLANANLAVENYWGQFGSEEGYNDYFNQIKEQERLEYLDIKEARDKKYALEQELNSLRRRTGGTTSIVSSALSSGGGIYDPSSRIETDRVRALQDEINALERDINLASRKQTNKYLTDRAVNAEDFGKYSFDPIIPEEKKVINPHQQNIERDNSAERFMTEDEKAIYNYYFNKIGEAKAEEYLDSIQEDLNFRQAKAIFEGNEDNVLAQLALMAPTQGLEQSKSGFQGALRMVMGDDSYQPVGTYDYLGQMAKEDLADKGFKLPEWMGGQSIGQLAYDLVNTGANMAPSIAVGALTGTGPLAFGASAAGNAYTQKINEGYSKDQATAYGVIIGVSEATLEKVVGAIGFGGKTLASKAVAKLLPKIDNAAARIAVKYGSSMLSEGIEEGLQEVLEPLYRNAAFGENNELEITEDAIYSALLGALSGGLMEGTPYAISEGINASYQNKINEKYGKSVGEIVNEGLSAPQDSEAYKLAKEAKAKLNAGEELSEEELDVLAKVSAEVPQERKQAVTEASEEKPIVLQSKEIPNSGRRTVGISEKQMETFASKLPNATKDTGRQVAAMYDIKDGVSKETFIKGVDEAYRYGSMNFSLEEMDRGGSFAKDIPSEKKLQAYYMGQRNAETATITKANEEQKKALSGVKGKVVFEGNAATQIKNNQQRSTIRFINSVLKNASSMEYHIFASYEEDGKRVYKNNNGEVVAAPNGFYDPKNHQIWIDVNAGTKGQGIMLYTLTHEHVHDIKVWSAEHYNELVKITSQAFEHAGKSFKEAVDVKYAQYKKNHPDTTYEDAQEEVVAEAMSGLLSDEKGLREFSEQIQKQDKGLWNKIKAWFNDVIARITAAYKGVEPESEEAKLLMEQKELFEHAQKVFAEAVVTAGEKYKAHSEAFKDLVKSTEGDTDVYKDKNGAVVAVVTKQTNGDTGVKHQDRLSNADKNRVEILENKNARLEKELADLEKAYESVQNYARAEGILIGQVEQGRTMAKEMRQKQATFDRKAKGYENAIAKKKEQISAVRQQKNELLAKAKAERAEAVERVRKADRERMEKAIADIKAAERAKFNAAKERSDEQKRAIIEKYQTSIKKATEGRHRTDIRGKIKRVVNELNTLLTKQTKERHIPLELQKPVADALDILNLDDQRYYESRIRGLEARIAEAKSSEERHLLQEELNKIIDQRTAFKDKIAGLKKAYEGIRTSTDPYIAVGYNENIAKMIDRVAEDIGDTLLRDMNMTQLQEVYDLYKGILKTVRDANKFFNEEKGASVVEAGRNVVSEIEASGKTIDQISKKKLERKKFFWNNLKPVYAFKKLGSKTLENLFGGILKGQGTWAKDVSEAKDFFERIGNKYGYKKWDKKKTFEFTSNTGKKFSLNLQQMMSLYAYSKRDQALDHLTDGGFVFDNKETIKKNGKEYVVNTAQAYNISAATLQQIIGKLSTDQRMFVDEMQKYLSETMGAKGNEVSRAMYDIELFREAEGYFPLKSAKQFLYDRNEVTNETRQLVNSGFTKPIQPGANNPIILTGFMDVWANHVNDMSMYHAFVMPIENFNKVYNFQFGRSEESDSKSVKSAIQDSFTEAANQYIEQLLKDINGGARVDSRESTYKRLIGNWKKAAVFASASVVIQQPSAIGRAFAEINPIYFMAPTEIGVLKHKKQWEQLKKYAPVAVIKEMGYFDTDMGQSTAEFIKGEKTLKDRADDIFGWAPAKADEYTWCAIWDAVKRETKAKHKDLNVNSEEFLKIAGERFTEVIDKTQVYDSVLSRSGNMRSKSIFMQMLTAFMAEPTTSANMVEQAFREAKAGHPKKAMAYVNSVGASVIINSLLVSFVYALRDDDEDERFHDKYLEALLKELADGINPLTYIPLAKDVWSIFQGWDVERVDMSLFKDLYDNLEKEVKTVKELVEGIIDGSLSEEEIKAGFKEAGEYMFPVLDTIASMNGIPLKNLRRDFYTMPKNTFKIFNQNQKELSYSEKYLWDILHEAFLDQTPFGHIFFESKDEKLFNAFDSEDKVYIGRLEKTYSSEDAYSNAAKAVIKKGVIGGEFSESQAKTYLVDYIGLKPDDAEGYIHSWKFEEKWGFAWSDRAEAYANGQIKEDKLKQAVMEYKEFSAEETDKAEKEVEKIKFKAENGFDYSARRNEYIEGNITKEQLKKALMDVDGKTSEEADMQIKLYDLQKAGFEEVTEYAVKDYYEFCEPAGISEEVYFKFFEETKDIKGDYDSKGESIPYSKTKKIMPYIAKLPLTAKQKTAVAKSFGWADKTIAKYRLW